MPYSVESPESTPHASLPKAFAHFAICILAGLGLVAVTFYLDAHHAGPWAAFAAVMVFCAIIMAVVARRLRNAPSVALSPASRRYTWRFLTAITLYCAVLFGALMIFNDFHPAGSLAYALAVAPALPLIAAIAAMGIYLREETDEFQRLVHIESALRATGGMLAVASVWGFLETFHLAPHVESWAAFPVWAALLAPSQIITRWRYQ